MFRQAIYLFGFSTVCAVVHGAFVGLPEPPPESPEATSCEAPVGAIATGPQWISTGDAAELAALGTGVFVDARSLEEYSSGHIAGALALPPDLASPPPDSFLRALGSSATVVVYCDTTESCGRSTRLATQILGSSQLGDVRVLEGGFPAWLKRSHPAQSGPCTDVCPWLERG